MVQQGHVLLQLPFQTQSLQFFFFCSSSSSKCCKPKKKNGPPMIMNAASTTLDHTFRPPCPPYLFPYPPPPPPLFLKHLPMSPVSLRHRKNSKSFATAAAQQPPPPDSSPPPSSPPRLQTLARRFWKVAAPYWYSSDDQVQARWRLLVVFALTLGTTGISVGFNFLGRDFYNALANKDQEQFTKQLLYYLAGFAGGIPFFVLRDYARDTLSLRWRSWMTSYYMERYLKNQTFYKIQSQSILDNPDQRIVDDLSSFTGTALSFSLTLFNAAVDLISFSNILYGIYPPLFAVLLVYSVAGTAISIFLGKDLVTLNFLQEKKEADFRYGLVRVRENAESIAFYGGEGNEMQLLLQRFRSAFENLTQLLISSRNLEFFTGGYRYLIQVLPVAVVAPMYFAGKIEFGVINQSVSAFNHILGDFSLIVYQFQAISAFSAIIDRLGLITLKIIQRHQEIEALQLFSLEYSLIGEFDDVLDSQNIKGRSESMERILINFCCISAMETLETNGSFSLDKSVKLLDVEHLTLQTPTSGTTLIRDLSVEICENDHLLVAGPSGSGKTSLLRALAGLWNSGHGKITFYVEDARDPQSSISQELASCVVASTHETDGNLHSLRQGSSRSLFFLPQKPYMVLGTLRQQLLYPTWTEDPTSALDAAKSTAMLPFLIRTPSINCQNMRPSPPTNDELRRVLEDVGLGYLLSRCNSLDSINEWSNVLSLGEQQRLAFARLLLSKPYLALLDEATSALDEANEANLYRKIGAAGITYVSIGHRRTLYNYHARVLHISTVEPLSIQRNWNIEPINPDRVYNLSKQ